MGDLLKGKVAAVTGAGRGIGRSVAIGLAGEGASVVVNDLGVDPEGAGMDDGPAIQVVQEILGRGGTAVPDTGNIATMNGGQALVKTAVDNFGRLDILVNVAGIFRHNLIFDMPDKDWDAVLDVHLKGHFACIQAALPSMREQGFGRIVNFSSGVATHGRAAAANYGAAKGAIIGLTRALARETAEYGITSNAIAPAAETRVTLGYGRRVNEMRDKSGAEQTGGKAHSLPDPEFIVPAITYLCTDEAARINGEVFHLTGGLVQRAFPERPYRSITKGDAWTSADLEKALQPGLLFDIQNPAPATVQEAVRPT
ncbi:SDR family NAD(P)-dependent oxidoreductase [Nonomuraea sp. NPDC005650]|uniref:SDR family NAD(P)-dependent oxidoreductase n=1 Tax=Nonomuraea sp. NPDC005650 TaxID=3157045 RepID=UPI0033B0F699